MGRTRLLAPRGRNCHSRQESLQRLLNKIDQTLRDGDDDQLASYEKKLTDMERELEQVNVPLSYMEEFYNLRLHVDLVKRRLASQREETAK